ncbi:hypothetical protein SHI21_04655 [Bacteriovorax sp. PP10]|uniref:Uncharacterized protein n=1 Tax=Bacteriovorax antarcticus TaxID=3088717 RepID=A0ABU5VR11_9BACT|nr:hypothetical protein [Bacteriovorax sp. PP10]MEA9355474.1 hypothetical protein [Bacteriovorax sp. PP10]
MKKLFLILVTCFFMTTAFAGLEEIFGNADVGDSCQSDYQCASLCCNNKKQCSEHGSNGQKCNKVPGESCVTTEFCKPYYVETCKLVKTGTMPNGKVGCILRCPAVETPSSCVNSVCVAPSVPPVPPFDPADPDCSNAVDP